jgi:hypothetical protein
MAIQDFTAGQVLTAVQMDNLQANDYNQTVSTKTASYTLVAADKGTRVVMNSASATTITVNTSLFSAGDTLFLQNISTGVSTVTAGTATVSSAGPLAIPQNGSGILYFTSAGVSIYYPSAVTATASGLTLLDVTTFSASSAVNVTNKLLAATYANYLIITSYNSPANNNTLNMRFRENVTDKATGYNRGTTILSIGLGSSSVSATSAGTTIRLGTYDTTDAKIATNVINLTLTNGGANGQITSAGMDISNGAFETMGAYNMTCTAITGFSLIPAAGTITGTVRTYAYANS